MIKALLFDLGGVIIRKKNANDDFPTLLAELIGADPLKLKSAYSAYKHIYRRGKLSEAKFWSLISEQLKQTIDPAQAMALYITMREEVPGMIDLLKELTKKYTLVLANNQAQAFDEIRNKHFNLFNYFDFRCSSWLTGYEKPESTFFENILEQTGFKPEECLFIDDNPKFIAGAKKVNIKGIMFSNTETLKIELEKQNIITYTT